MRAIVEQMHAIVEQMRHSCDALVRGANVDEAKERLAWRRRNQDLLRTPTGGRTGLERADWGMDDQSKSCNYLE